MKVNISFAVMREDASSIEHLTFEVMMITAFDLMGEDASSIAEHLIPVIPSEVSEFAQQTLKRVERPCVPLEVAVAREYIFCVYVMQSPSRRALYIGVTSNLHRRVWQHKTHAFEGFTDDYNSVRLVYWESFDDVHKAIAREKQLKNWRRDKKSSLIEHFNPGWKDLAAEWYGAQGPTPASYTSNENLRSG